MELTPLEEFVLTYKGTDGNPLISIRHYYDTYVSQLDELYSRYSLETSSTVICCFKDVHEDTDPSLGVKINGRKKGLEGVEFYHCFGCGSAGNAITMHRRIQDLYYGIKLTGDEVAISLADLYNIDVREFLELDAKLAYARYHKRLKTIKILSKDYSIRDYSAELLRARGETDLDKCKSLANSALIKIISNKKELY